MLCFLFVFLIGGVGGGVVVVFLVIVAKSFPNFCSRKCTFSRCKRRLALFGKRAKLSGTNICSCKLQIVASTVNDKCSITLGL